MSDVTQLVSYIAPGAPATRRPADGNELFLRPEIGFTPAWYRQHLEINFGERFHTDPAYRRDCVAKMRHELNRRFPGQAIGGADRPDAPLDRLTGTYGACTVAGIYGVPLIYADIEAGTADARVAELVELCKKLSLPTWAFRSVIAGTIPRDDPGLA